MSKKDEKFQKVTDEPVIMPESQESPEQPAAQPATAKQPESKKSIVPILIGVVVLVGLGIGAYFLLNKPATSPANNNTDETEEPVEELTNEERLEKIDEEIAASTEETHLPLVIEKAQRQIAAQQYDEALTTLSSISESGLDDIQLYQLYSMYIYLFTEKGDEKQTEEYTAKSDAVYQKLEAAGVFGTPVEENTEESVE